MQRRRAPRDRRRPRECGSRRHLLAHAHPLELDAHERSLAGSGIELDPAVERAHRLPHDRETEAEALGVAVLATVEAIEHMRLRLRIHADARVLDLHTEILS